MVDPDLEIRGEGVGGSPKKFFSALWASVSSRNDGGGGQSPSPGSPLLNLVSKLGVTPFGHR